MVYKGKLKVMYVIGKICNYCTLKVESNSFTKVSSKNNFTSSFSHLSLALAVHLGLAIALYGMSLQIQKIKTKDYVRSTLVSQPCQMLVLYDLKHVALEQPYFYRKHICGSGPKTWFVVVVVVIDICFHCFTVFVCTVSALPNWPFGSCFFERPIW